MLESKLVVWAFRLRLVKSGMGKGIVKPRKPYVVTTDNLKIPSKHALKLFSMK